MSYVGMRNKMFITLSTVTKTCRKNWRDMYYQIGSVIALTVKLVSFVTHSKEAVCVSDEI
jgi:hypothetical protein